MTDTRTHTMLAERLSEITTLYSGSHDAGTEMCAMEAAAYVAGEPWSDKPRCVCPVIGVFMRSWNDGLPDNASRDSLLLPLIPTVIDTRSTKAVEHRRAMMAADWLIRVHTVAWLRLAKLDSHADALAALPEITDFAQCSALMPTLKAAWDAARAAARDAARDAAWAAARDAARDAAKDAAWDAAWNAAGAVLASTVAELQQSAVALVQRMTAVTEASND